MEPRNYIPVTYVTELSWLSEAAKLLPTILLIGGYIYFQRKMQGGLGMGGGGGAGGARGIFNVGKAQVSKIDKNAKDKVRGCWV
jgi:AFG3 family protein